MKTGLFLLGRTGASRLPKKVLLEVMGQPLFSYLIERLKKVKKADCFVLGTTQLAEDDVLIKLAKQAGIVEVYRGSAEDMIERMLHAAKVYAVDFVVSVTGDNIFADPPHIDLVIDKYKETEADFIYCPDLPLGCSSYAVKTSALEAVHQMHKGKTDHGWDLYFLKNDRFRVETVSVSPEFRRPELRMTVDYPEDFQFFKAILESLYIPGSMFSLRDIINFIDSHPDIAALGQKRAGDWQKLRKTFVDNVTKGQISC